MAEADLASAIICDAGPLIHRDELEKRTSAERAILTNARPLLTTMPQR